MNYLIPLIALILISCSFKYTDRNGNQNIVGCMWVKHKIDRNPVIVQTKSLGISFDINSTSSGINLGYKNSIEITPTQEDRIYYIDYDTNNPFNTILKETSSYGSSNSSLMELE